MPRQVSGKSDAITGTKQNDVLFGSAAGQVLRGGEGDDVYHINDPTQVIFERNNGGHDKVFSSVSRTLEGNLEDLELVGSEDLDATGNAENNEIIGNAGANFLNGLAGDDTLSGGAGDDILSGGEGADLINGGDGEDIAVFEGRLEDYAITVEDGTVTVFDGEWNDTLVEVEMLAFSDGSIAVSDLAPSDPAPAISAADDTATASPGTEINIQVLQNDLGQNLTLESVSQPGKGSVTFSEDGIVVYVPAEGASGFDRFSYTVRDASGQTATAEISIEIYEANEAPNAGADAFSMAAGTSYTPDASVLANDVDPDGDALLVVGAGLPGSYAVAEADPGAVFSAETSAGGNVNIAADGTFTYTPAEGFIGLDEFEYTVSDGTGGQGMARVEIQVLGPAILAADDAALTNEDEDVTISVLGNDSGEQLRITEIGRADRGTVVVNGDGTLTYSPNADAFGADSFSYEVTDAYGQTAIGTVTVDISPVNDDPNAQDDHFDVVAGDTLATTVSLLDNDGDPDGDTVTLTGFDDVSAGGAAVVVNPDGTFTYFAAEGFSGTDSFGYSVTDGAGGTSSAVVHIDVRETGEPEPYVDALIYGRDIRLNTPDDPGTPTTVTFAFLEEVPDYYPADSFPNEGFAAFSDAHRQATLSLLSDVASFTNLTFVETTAEEAEITFGLADLPGFYGVAYEPGTDGVGNTASDVWIDVARAGEDFVPGTDGYHTLVHELGHALGLSHGTLEGAEDTLMYTVMDNSLHPTFSGSATGFQMYDIASLQYFYGENREASAGDDVYGAEQLEGQIVTIWDGGGTDRIDMSAASTGVSVDLNAGAFSTVAESGLNNVAIAVGTEIENATGSDWDDVLIGNELDNYIVGGSGNDTLAGGGGADTYGFEGGWGQDTIEDYTVGEDQLDFSGTGLKLEDLQIVALDGDTILTHGENSLRLVGIDGTEEEFDETALII